uniref:Uncharacterized protein n=1 Tax=Salarias fasciatus TaxID=181472 RepID=A0A672HML4_SALFA
MDSSTVSYNPGNAVMVTPVLPDAPNGEQQPSLDRRHNFRKGHPKALGIVQIMTGALMLLSGIAMAFYQPSVEVATRFIVGGALIYITSGAVTVAAEKFLSHCLINTSLAFNIIAAMAAAAAAIMYAFGLVFMSLFSVFSSQDYSGGYLAMLAMLQFVELIISIIVARYACNATCGCCTEVSQRLTVNLCPCRFTRLITHPSAWVCGFII